MNNSTTGRWLHVFQGDSITDCGRARSGPETLGGGYAFMVAAGLQFQKPALKAEFINRGISGNRVKDLEARWTEDCIAMQPDSLSILIGANDVWRRFDCQDPTSVEAFEAGYRRLLDRVRGETKTRITLLEPFVLYVNPERATWAEDLDPKRAVVRKLAGEYRTGFIPLHEILAAQAELTGPAYWAADGVHPTPAGHALIADALVRHLVQG